jgi:cell division septum initiation protein DivIVA
LNTQTANASRENYKTHSWRCGIFLIIASLVFTPSIANSVSVKAGGSCTKVNSFSQTSKTLLVCVSTKGKKVWRKASSVEKALYLKERARLATVAAQKIIDRAKIEADRVLAEAKVAAEKATADAAAKAAADQAATAKAAADKAAAEAAEKAAAEVAAKVAAETAAKAAADKAAADKAAADQAARAAAAKAAADRAAADAAARAADVPSLIAGRFFSGQDLDNSSWKWVAVEIRNSSPYSILSHRSYDVLIGDAGGAVVDSSWEPGFPLLLPNQSAWYVTTQFNTSSSSQIVFRKTYSTQPSPLTASEFPAATNSRIVSSTFNASRKAVSFTLKNNSGSRILASSSKAFAVIFNSAGVPVYAESGFIGKSVLPGGQTEITFGDFTFSGDYSSIQVTIGVNLD